MQKFKVFLSIVFLVFISSAFQLYAQSAEIIDNVIGSQSISYGEASYLAALGSGLADEEADINSAYAIINSSGFNRDAKAAAQPVTLGEFSYILMKSLEMKGGLMYSLFPITKVCRPRTEYLGIIDFEAHPGNPLKGTEALNMLSELLRFKGGGIVKNLKIFVLAVITICLPFAVVSAMDFGGSLASATSYSSAGDGSLQNEEAVGLWV